MSAYRVEIHVLKYYHFQLLNYGATVKSISVPDESGELDDVTFGFDNLEGYLGRNPYFGCVVGRVANRIANAKFTINGKEHNLAANNGNNALHGGLKGFDKRLWNVCVKEGNVVTFSYLSKDGEEGYPGSLMVNATYELTEANELKLSFYALASTPTPVNLTNHAYFNLGEERVIRQMFSS